jgi:hypothetical protein
MMSQQSKGIDWEEIQNNELRVWYYIAKITGNILDGGFPYYTFAELWKQISEDPEYKKKEEE